MYLLSVSTLYKDVLWGTGHTCSSDYSNLGRTQSNTASVCLLSHELEILHLFRTNDEKLWCTYLLSTWTLQMIFWKFGSWQTHIWFLTVSNTLVSNINTSSCSILSHDYWVVHALFSVITLVIVKRLKVFPLLLIQDNCLKSVYTLNHITWT